MDDHPGRLVHDDDHIVLVQDVERNVLWHGPFTWHFELEHRNQAPFPQFQRGPARVGVDADLTGLDRPLERRPAEGVQPLGKKNVEPSAGRLGRNRE
jgi:hypothetical protein